MSAGELSQYMTGKVSMFGSRGQGDEITNGSQIVVVEVTDMSDAEVELAFDVPGTTRRLYLRVSQEALTRAMEDAP